MEMHPPTPRAWLQQEYERRRARNPRYSLRAFAGHIGLQPGRLSEILSSKRWLTVRMGERISERLGWEEQRRSEFLSRIRVEEKLRRSRAVDPALIARSEPEYLKLSEDAFRVIADWEHYAILSLMATKGFRAEPAWIGRRLGIDEERAAAAIERLLRLQLARDDRGRLVPTHAYLTPADDIASAALKHSRRQDLERALTALEEVPVEERDITAVTIAIDVSKLPHAKQLIRSFRRRLCALLEDGRRTEVYSLNVQLVPVSRRVEE